MPAPFRDDVRTFVDSAVWTFAKTYAGTWPHEYVVRTSQNITMILALARHIFEHGIDGRFYSQTRKYHHEGGKVYWSMDPTPDATTLVNRCDEALSWLPASISLPLTTDATATTLAASYAEQLNV